MDADLDPCRNAFTSLRPLVKDGFFTLNFFAFESAQSPKACAFSRSHSYATAFFSNGEQTQTAPSSSPSKSSASSARTSPCGMATPGSSASVAKSTTPGPCTSRRSRFIERSTRKTRLMGHSCGGLGPRWSGKMGGRCSRSRSSSHQQILGRRRWIWVVPQPFVFQAVEG